MHFWPYCFTRSGPIRPDCAVSVAIVSIELARFLGFFMCIVGFGIAFNSTHMLKIASDLPQNHGMQFAGSLFPALVGSMIVAIHNQWSSNWTCVITVIGWLMVLSACYRAWLPAHWAATAHKCARKVTFHIMGSIVGIVGLYLLYKGWINPS